MNNIHDLSNADLDAAIIRRESRAGLHRFRLLGEAADGVVAKLHLIKGIFARGESSAWIAPPGGLKSALLASAAFAVATGADWFGFRNKGAAPVVIVALERADLVARRLRAHAEREGLDRMTDVAIVNDAVDLMRARNTRKFIATLRAIEAEFGAPVGLVIVDTFAKLVAAGGGDEDKARDQNAVFANIQQVKNAIGCHVALVGHTGKNESRGARGSSALPGDVDLLVMISGAEVKTATVTKANDAPEGALFSFTSDVHAFGIDADGDPVTVNVAVQAERVEGEADAAGPSKQLSVRQRLGLDALTEVLLGRGRPAPVEFGLPLGIAVVGIEEWREELFRRAVLDRQGTNPRADFRRLQDQLTVRGLIGRRDGLVWSAR